MLDGVGDRAHKVLGNKTPLQKARTPALDALARLGSCGLYHATQVGQNLPSETAHLVIFGYGIDEFPGRGPLEALGAGIEFGPGEVAILAHLACVEEKDGTLVLRNGEPALTDGEADELFGIVSRYEKKGISLRAHRYKGAYGIIILSENASPFITDSDSVARGLPLQKIVPWEEAEADEEAVETSCFMNSYTLWAHHVLNGYAINSARREQGLNAINAIVTQRAGRLKKVPAMHDRYGLRSLSISSASIYRGIAGYIGMDSIVLPSRPPEQDFTGKISLALEKFRDYDFIHVHSKEPDEASHRKDPVLKMKAIEALDRGIGAHLKGLLAREDLLVVVMGDHSTPSSGPLVHSGEPVPVIFCGRGTRRDRVRRYDEIRAATGALGTLRGRELILSILNIMDRSKLAGLRDCAADQPFWPGRSSPLKL